MSEPITPFQAEDLKIKRWDLLLKLGTVVVAAVGACLAYNGLLVQMQQAQDKQLADRQAELRLREQEIQQREKDYKLRFYRHQADAYFELCEATAKIALARRAGGPSAPRCTRGRGETPPPANSRPWQTPWPSPAASRSATHSPTSASCRPTARSAKCLRSNNGSCRPNMGICTHCGEDKKTTRDHDIAVCLWVETPAERAIKVPSCSVCNNRSEEGLLKSFLSLFDERLAQARLGDELLRPQGKGDLRSFVGVFRRRWPALSAVVVKSAWSRIVAGVPVGRVWVNPDAAVTLPPEVLAHLEAA